MVGSTFPARTFAEFIAYAKQNPGKVEHRLLHRGGAGADRDNEQARRHRTAGVAYKGTPATITDVLGGSLDATLVDPGNALAQVKGGKMRALAVTSLKRNPVTPDWPAISETLPGFDFPSWNALVGPAGMPRELVNKINAAMNSALKAEGRRRQVRPGRNDAARS